MLIEGLYVLVYPNGSFVGVDDGGGPMSSGGNPYETNFLPQARIWRTRDEAVRYAMHFTNKEFMLGRLTVNIVKEPVSAL